MEINIYIACYVIDEVKNFDIQTGDNTPIVIIDNEGYKEISKEKQVESYNKMIDNLSNTLGIQLSDNRTASKILKEIMPVTKSIQLMNIY